MADAVCSKDEPDRELVDPWFDSIGPLFNDEIFSQSYVSILRGDVKKSVVDKIDLSISRQKRDALTLSKKFADFKSQYGVEVAKYTAYGPRNHSGFVKFLNKAHILYRYCLLEKTLFLELLTTGAISEARNGRRGWKMVSNQRLDKGESQTVWGV